MDALRNYNDINEEVRTKGGQGERIQVELNPKEEVNMCKIEELYAHVSIPLQQGSRVSLIFIVVVIMTIYMTHGYSNNFVNELLKICQHQESYQIGM